MKRKSKVEIALNQEIKRIENLIDCTKIDMLKLQARLEGLQETQRGIQRQADHLERQRCDPR